MRFFTYMFLAFLIILEGNSADAQDSSGDQADFVVEAYVTNDSPFVGEQFEYVFRFHASQRPPDLIDELPDFDGFWLVEISDPEDLSVETIDGRQFFVGERRVVLTPNQEGSLEIGPATLLLPETVFREGARYSTNSVAIEVQPLPVGAPKTFSDAVGQYHAEVSVDQTNVTLGQPITLIMEITGAGNLESLRTPHLDSPTGWRIYTNPTRYTTTNINEFRVGKKTFEWLVIPERTGYLLFPRVEFVFFNPQTQEYVSLVEEPVSISVLPGSGLVELPAFDPEAYELPPLAIKSASKGLRSDSPELGVVLWVLFMIMPILPVSSAAWKYGKQYRRRRQLISRRSNALRRASKRLRQARKRSRFQASEQTMRTIYRFLADKIGCSVGSINGTPINSILTEQQVAPELIAILLDNLMQAESISYAPDELEMDIDPIIAQIMATLVSLDEALTAP